MKKKTENGLKNESREYKNQAKTKQWICSSTCRGKVYCLTDTQLAFWKLMDIRAHISKVIYLQYWKTTFPHSLKPHLTHSKIFTSWTVPVLFAASTFWHGRQISSLSWLEMPDHSAIATGAVADPSEDATPTHSFNSWLFLIISWSSKLQGRWPRPQSKQCWQFLQVWCCHKNHSMGILDSGANSLCTEDWKFVN